MPATTTWNRIGATAMTALSLVALGTIAIGFNRPPEPDEGTLAHIFQLSVAACLPALLLYGATADWSDPKRVARRLVLPFVALAIAFTALYVMEHRH